jgi:hypothetical protein
MKSQSTSSIYAHRGLWGKTAKNSLESIQAAVDSGFSVETDIRDFEGSVVISHDPVKANAYVDFARVAPLESKFALNIKSDGLVPLLQSINVDRFNSFFFDGSIPELYRYKNAGLRTAIRISEFEHEKPWESSFIWLDSFLSDWWLSSSILQKESETSEVIVVSPELHGRDKGAVWEYVAMEISKGNQNISICTDFTDEFKKFL